MLVHRMYSINIFKWINEYIHEWKFPWSSKKYCKTYFPNILLPFWIPFCFWPPVPEICSCSNWRCPLDIWTTCLTALKLSYFISWTQVASFPGMMSFCTEDLDIFLVYSHGQPWPEMVRSYEWILMNIINFI